MQKPYQDDIEFLKMELEHHQYVATKFEQEHDIHTTEFKAICEEIRAAIKIMENRQSIASSEWAALPPRQREFILMPLQNAIDLSISNVRRSGCQEYATYLEQYLYNFMMELYEFKE